MSERKEGWYWVKDLTEYKDNPSSLFVWEVWEYAVDQWQSSSGVVKDENELIEDMLQIGPRIPTPDEQAKWVITGGEYHLNGEVN